MKSIGMLLTTLAFASLTKPVIAGVIVVNTAGGADFTAIQPAIDAASDGDTILVKTGSYAGFTIDGKGVVVVEDASANVQIQSTIVVRNVPLASRVVLNGLKVRPPARSNQSAFGLRAQNNAGAIRLHQCDIAGGNGADGAPDCSTILHASPGSVGMQFESSPDVAFTECYAWGGKGGNHGCPLFENPGNGADAVACQSSRVVAYMSEFFAGDTGTGGDRPATGGDGLQVDAASGAFVCGSLVLGGRGSNPTFDARGCWPAGNGGAALHWFGTPSFLWRLAGVLTGGAGGSTPGCSNQGMQGAATLGSGSPFTFAVSPLALQAPSVAREGQMIAITFVGDPGDIVGLFEGDDTAFLGLAQWRGFRLVADSPGPERSIKFGTIPANGTLTRSFHVPMLPSGVESEVLYMQAYRRAQSGLTLGSFVPMVVLDSSF